MFGIAMVAKEEEIQFHMKILLTGLLRRKFPIRGLCYVMVIQPRGRFGVISSYKVSSEAKRKIYNFRTEFIRRKRTIFTFQCNYDNVLNMQNVWF